MAELELLTAIGFDPRHHGEAVLQVPEELELTKAEDWVRRGLARWRAAEEATPVIADVRSIRLDTTPLFDGEEPGRFRPFKRRRP